MVKLEEPDTGRAWVVAIAACVINMILSGISRMIGILYVAVLDEYKVTRQEATLPFTVRNSIRMLSGPIVGVIGQSFGIKTVTIIGGVIASTGAALCCIAPNITWLAILWGGVHGLGFALANTLFQVVVNQYFYKYRATASGIALSGACLGSLVFPIMIEAILDTYGLSGGFLILGGVVMHVLPPSILMCSPQWIEHPKAYARLKALQNCSKSSDTLDTTDAVGECNSVSEDNLTSASKLRATSMDNPGEQVSCQVIHNSFVQEQQNENCCKDRSGMKGSGVVCTLYKIQESPNLTKKVNNEDAHNLPKNENVPSLYSTSGQVKVNNQDGDSLKVNPDTNTVMSPDASTVNTPPRKESHMSSLLESVQSMMALFKNPMYILISVCMSSYIIVFIPILTVVVDYSKDKGIPESSGKYLINAMAIGDLAGRLCFGWITDKGLMTIPAFFTLNLILQGVFIALFPVAMTLWTYMILLALYGVTAGSMLVLFPILVLKYVDLHSQSVAMACVGFLSGIMSFGIPPMIGHFRDVVGSYDDMFYIVGAVSVLSGGLWLFEPIAAKRFQKRYAKTESMANVLQNNFDNQTKQDNSNRT